MHNFLIRYSAIGGYIIFLCMTFILIASDRLFSVFLFLLPYIFKLGFRKYDLLIAKELYRQIKKKTIILGKVIRKGIMTDALFYYLVILLLLIYIIFG